MAPASSGPFSTRRRPMMRPILECGHPQSGVRNLSITGGSQILKTTCCILILGYRIPNSPMPTLILGPAETWLKEEISKKRMQALIDANAVLRVHKPYDANRYSLLSMEMSGGTITLEGASSPTSTSGSTMGIVYVAEAAKIEHHDSEQRPESHPIKLAFERTKEFRGLELHVSDFTPNHPHHLAWLNHLRGTQTHFHVPCPHCGHYFPMEFEIKKNTSHADGEEDEAETVLEESQEEARPDYYRSLIWAPDARRADGSWDMDRVKETALYICPKNGCEITDQDKPGMIDKFEESHHNPNAPMSDRSFRIPSFYAPRVSFGDMAEQFLQRGDLFTTGLQNFYNSWLGLPWSALSGNVKEDHVLKLKGEYARRVLPSRPAMLLLTCDPGEKATHWEVNAIMPNAEMFLIDWDTATGPEELIKVEFMKQRRYFIAGTSEARMPDLGYIDCGWNTEKVYDVCEHSRGFFWPTKGDKHAWGTWKETRAASRPHLRLFTYSDTQLKNELYGRIIQRRKDPKFHLPHDVTLDVIKGHSDQQKDRATGKWKEILTDHFGDCTKLAVLGRQIGSQLLTRLNRKTG